MAKQLARIIDLYRQNLIISTVYSSFLKSANSLAIGIIYISKFPKKI